MHSASAHRLSKKAQMREFDDLRNLEQIQEETQTLRGLKAAGFLRRRISRKVPARVRRSSAGQKTRFRNNRLRAVYSKAIELA